ncbi:hypothetical protein B0H66DRAFT_563311 [Apodospora peruviana]|uniref:Uncharacterized protein n=1 Tax=Apodospora peruviana TaxID=516989 RepID=A0AAE0M0K1_9PEZI|nr:hypothetical protein B0H66DRAFT_563311 [Apodospora peruviana]
MSTLKVDVRQVEAASNEHMALTYHITEQHRCMHLEYRRERVHDTINSLYGIIIQVCLFTFRFPFSRKSEHSATIIVILLPIPSLILLQELVSVHCYHRSRIALLPYRFEQLL